MSDFKLASSIHTHIHKRTYSVTFTHRKKVYYELNAATFLVEGVLANRHGVHGVLSQSITCVVLDGGERVEVLQDGGD